MNVTTEPPPFIYFNTRELDIVIGTVYLFFGLFGMWSSGSVLWYFWGAKATVKIHPFTLCALVLAANDLLYCTLGISPYAVLILAKRPQPEFFPGFLCKIFGFVNHFCDRFAWFDITCIMVFRCVTTVFPLQLRGVTYRPFIYILSFLALLQGSICLLPFFGLDIIGYEGDYIYWPNLGECMFGFDATRAPGMVALIDVLWWSPFLACILSCVIFLIVMRIHAKRITIARKPDKTNDVKKKTVLLTAFFIACYFPKALLILVDFLMNTERYISWNWFYHVMGSPERAVRLYLYLSTMFKWVIPAGRAAFTPTVLRLKTYLEICDTRRRSRHSISNTQSRLSTVATGVNTGVSIIKSKIFGPDSQKLLKPNLDSEYEVKIEMRGKEPQPV